MPVNEADEFFESLMVESLVKQAKDFATPEALKTYLHDHPDADKSKHHVKKDEGGGKKKDEHTPHSLRDKAEEHTKAGKHDEAAVHYMASAEKFREQGSHGAAKSMDDAARESAKKHFKKKKSSDHVAVDEFSEAVLVRNILARAAADDTDE